MATAPPSTDFAVEFEPGDEQISWEWDDMHMPFAMTALAGDYVRELIGGGINEHLRLFDFPQRMPGSMLKRDNHFAVPRNDPNSERAAEPRCQFHVHLP